MELQKPSKVESPQDLSEKTLDKPANNPQKPPPPPPTEEPSKESKSPIPETASGTSSAPVSHLQKKALRAERFGMPLQLSEDEKRNSRAERFGTGSTSLGSEETKISEELKRKSRAERFGLAAQSTVAEEAKKKARLARFAPNSKPDTLEEDKRKARAIRFSQTSPGTPSHKNGKSNELKTTIAVKTDGAV